MDYRIAFWKFSSHRQRLNAIALAILVFNITNPHLAKAEAQPRAMVASSLSTEPSSRLFKSKTKPRVVRGIITAYTSTPDQTDGNPEITASGKRVRDGIIAANGLPFGTIVKIPSLFGDKRFVVEDRMNARYEFGHFDVWFSGSRKDALRFGVKRVMVEIYYPEEHLALK